LLRQVFSGWTRSRPPVRFCRILFLRSVPAYPCGGRLARSPLQVIRPVVEVGEHPRERVQN